MISKMHSFLVTSIDFLGYASAVVRLYIIKCHIHVIQELIRLFHKSFDGWQNECMETFLFGYEKKPPRPHQLIL